MEKKYFNQQDIISDYSGFKRISFIPGETSEGDLSVMEIDCIQGMLVEHIIPEHYFTPTYMIELVTEGSLHITINNRNYEINANQGFLITPDFLLVRPKKKDNHIKMQVLSFSRKFAEELHLQFPLSLVAQIHIKPVWQMSEQKMRIALRYFDLIRDVIEVKNREAALFLVHSFFRFMAGDYALNIAKGAAMSRNEEITGRFMALIDEHCERHHALDWYADQLSLTTRYVANTVKQTLGMPAGSCIDFALTQRAKALLYTTTLSIQEIAERLGFKNQSHFGTFFRRHTGCNPKAFRQTAHE